ncbi:hypothetical protein E4U16_007469 [Claviceps sp. LM84 group G4]|nr:hypothetical protein E4U16_007469 [Claviceps sp. LM84 group G4]
MVSLVSPFESRPRALMLVQCHSWKGRRYVLHRDVWRFAGSYTQYCDLSRQYDPKPSPNTTNSKPDGVPVPPYTGEPIDGWFAPHGKLSLLSSMKKHWVSQYDPNWVFWAHEFSKHATCFSTFQSQCFVCIVLISRLNIPE